MNPLLFFLVSLVIPLYGTSNEQPLNEQPLNEQLLLARVNLSGPLLGKDRYRALYLIEPGEPFDEHKHQASIGKMKEELARTGYLDAQIADTLVRDPVTKALTVSLAIDQGEQFAFGKIDVTVQGLPDEKGLRERVARMATELLEGSSYSAQLLNDTAVKIRDYLMTQGFFKSTIALEESVHADTATVDIAMTITLASQTIFEFHGNTFFNKRELLDHMLLFGKSVELIPPSLIAQELVELYKNEGFWSVDVSWHDDGDRIFFLIKEGERVAVSCVKLRGVKELSADELVHTFFKQLVKGSPFRAELLKQALDGLGCHYIQQGFWDMRLVDTAYETHDGKHEVIITIEEGPRRWLNAVTVDKGYGFECDPYFARYQNLEKSIPFDASLLQEQRQHIVKMLALQGYLYVRPRHELRATERGITVIWHFDGFHEKVRFGDTKIQGSTRLPVELITRELAYSKGDIFNQQCIEQSVTRLKNLGIFDVVSLAPDDITVPAVCKNVTLKLIDDCPYEVRARLGIQGVNRNVVKFKAAGISAKAGGSFLVKNPFNQGDLFQADLDFSRYMHNITASYQIPWIFNHPIRTEFKGYSIRYDQPVVIGATQVLYQAAQDGALVGFSRSWGLADYGCNVGLEWMGIRPGSLVAGTNPRRGLSRAIQLDRRLIDHRFPYFFLEPTFYYSTLDNKIVPTTGYLSLVTLKGMVPPTLSDAAFLKVILEGSMYFPLAYDDWVLALRARCGTILLADFKRIIPIERFYLGGAYSVRSYEPDLVPPLNPFIDCNGCKRFVPIGGKSMLNLNAEVRFPLYQSLSGVGFLDFGGLSQKGVHALAQARMVGAAGFGLRLNTVVGPIRFDIGWKLNDPCIPGCEQRSYAWFLTLGNAF